MGQPDLALNALIRHNDVFADIVNVLVYGGKQVLREQDLQPYHESLEVSSSNKKILRGLSRDVCKENVKNGMRYQIIGIENQWKPDYTMPLRIMGYDYATYERQVEEIVKQNKERKNPAITGRIHPEQKLKPVITLVLYYGTEEMPHDVWGMLDMPEDEAVRHYIQNYRMNVLPLRDIPPEQIEQFQSDFRCIAKYISRSYNKEQTMMGLETDQGMLTHTKDTLIAMATITGDKQYLSVGERVKGEMAMCEIADAFVQRGMELGVEQGVSLGMLQGMIETLQELDIAREAAVAKVSAKFEMSEQQAEEAVEKYWK